MQRYEMGLLAATEQRREIAKKVAALLAENAVTVSEIDTIFDMAKAVSAGDKM